jgi:hypothetical protein
VVDRDPEMRDLFPFVVQVRYWSGQDDYGKDQYAEPRPYQANVQGTSRLVRNSEGQQITAEWTITLYSSDQVPANSLVILPDGTEEEILSVVRTSDENGWYSTTLYA